MRTDQHRRLRVGRGWLLAGLLLVGLLLAACRSSDSGGVGGRSYRERVPLVEADGPPCDLVAWAPYRNLRTTCIEVVYDAVVAPQAVPELTGLVFDPDGTLYMARAARGEIWAMPDADDDLIPDAPRLVADGFDRPARVAWHDAALWVLDGTGVTRVEWVVGAAGDRTPVIAGWPDGLLPGDFGWGPDGRLYVSLGPACFTCDAPEPARGVVLSYAADGGDPRTEATGLHTGAGLDWHPATGDLWISDGSRYMLSGANGDAALPADEINRLAARGEVPADFGFPYCTGAGEPDPAFALPAADFCQETQPPGVALPYQSQPAGLAFYPADATIGFEGWGADLLVVLRGSTGLPEPAGYALTRVDFADGDPSGTVEHIIPSAPSPYRLHEATTHYTLSEFSLSGFGFYPYHPADLAISPEGWIYVALEEGRIFRVRPRPVGPPPD